MSADSRRRRPTSLTQASRSKFEKEVFDDIANKLVQSTAVEESGFRPIRGGKEGEVEKEVLR